MRVCACINPNPNPNPNPYPNPNPNPNPNPDFQLCSQCVKQGLCIILCYYESGKLS